MCFCVKTSGSSMRSEARIPDHKNCVVVKQPGAARAALPKYSELLQTHKLDKPSTGTI